MDKKILVVIMFFSIFAVLLPRGLAYAAGDQQALQQQVNVLEQKVQRLERALSEQSEQEDFTADQGVDPFGEIGRMQSMMNRMMGNGGTPMMGARGFNANVDINETKDQYLIRMDLPGMDKSAINIETRGNQLIISGERKKQEEENNKAEHYYRKERSFGYFSRTIPLPENANKAKINAEYANGVLTVTIDKIKASEPKNTAKKIKVN